MKKQTEVIGTLNESQLNQLEQKHGKLIAVEVDFDENTGIGYFKKPSIKILSIIMKAFGIKADGSMEITDFEKFTNGIVQNCWVAGDLRIKEDEMASYGAAMQLFTIIKPRVARIKNG